MIFEAPAIRKEIGDHLDMHSVNYDKSPTYPLFRKGGKKIRLFLWGRIVRRI